MASKKKKDQNPDVHEDLKGFDIRINEFGEIISNFEIEDLNDFLNENVMDKKLTKDQPSLDFENKKDEEE